MGLRISRQTERAPEAYVDVELSLMCVLVSCERQPVLSVADKTPCQVLNLENNMLGYDGVGFFAEALAVQRTLPKLNI